MPHEHSAADFLPDRLSLKSLREAVQTCRACHLYERATHAVFGEGACKFRILMVGAQPGHWSTLTLRSTFARCKTALGARRRRTGKSLSR